MSELKALLKELASNELLIIKYKLIYYKYKLLRLIYKIYNYVFYDVFNDSLNQKESECYNKIYDAYLEVLRRGVKNNKSDKDNKNTL